MRILFTWLAILGFAVGAADTPVRTVPTLDELAVRLPDFGETLMVSGYHATNDWGAAREVRHVPGSTLATNIGNVFAVSNQPTARWVFSDRNSPKQDLRWWGPITNGFGTANIALREAATWLTNGGTILLAPQRFKFAAAVIITNNVSLEGSDRDSTILDFTEASIVTNAPCIRWQGRTVATNIIIADLPAGTNKIVLSAPPPPMAVGEVFVIHSTNDWSYMAGRSYYHAGQFGTFLSSSGNEVLMQDSIIENISATTVPTANALHFVKLAPITAKVSGLTVIAWAHSIGLEFQVSKDCVVEDVKAWGTDYTHVYFNVAYNTHVSRVFVDWDSDPIVGLNYGVTFGAAEYVDVSHCYLRTSRHGLDAGSSSFGLGIPNSFIRFHDSTVSSTRGNQFGAAFHENNRWGSYKNCDLPQGISMGGNHNEIIGCKIGNLAGAQAIAMSSTGANKGADFRIEDNDITYRNGTVPEGATMVRINWSPQAVTTSGSPVGIDTNYWAGSDGDKEGEWLRILNNKFRFIDPIERSIYGVLIDESSTLNNTNRFRKATFGGIEFRGNVFSYSSNQVFQLLTAGGNSQDVVGLYLQTRSNMVWNSWIVADNDFGALGIRAVGSAKKFQITNNRFRNALHKAAPIYITPNFFAYDNVGDIEIRGNEIRNASGSGMYIQDTLGTVTVADNIIENWGNFISGYGLYLTYSTANQAWSATSLKRATVERNVYSSGVSGASSAALIQNPGAEVHRRDEVFKGFALDTPAVVSLGLPDVRSYQTNNTRTTLPFRPGALTSAQQVAISTADDGSLAWDSTGTNLIQSVGGVWRVVGAGAGGGAVTVDTVAALKALIPSAANVNVLVLGYYNKGDWGSPRIFSATTAASTPNLGNVFQNINQPSVYYVAWDRLALEQDARWWGAIPDDALYDGINLQAVLFSGARVVSLSAGTFNLRDGDTIYGGLAITNTMTLKGAHRDSTIFNYIGSSNIVTIGPANWVGGGLIPVIQNVEVRDIYFFGAAGTQNHIKVRGATHGIIEDCRFSNAPIGNVILLEEGAWIWDITRCNIGFANVGIRMLAQGVSGSIISATHITGGEIVGCQWGILTGTTNSPPDIYQNTRLHANLWITDTTIESNGTNYVSGGRPGGGIWLNAAESVNIDGIYTEANPVDIRLGSLAATNALSCVNVNISQVRFADSTNGVQIYSASGVTLENNLWVNGRSTNIVVATTNVAKSKIGSGNINNQTAACPTVYDPLGLLVNECTGGSAGLTVNSIAALVATPPSAGNSNVMVLGYYAPGDWGIPRMFYQIDSAPGVSATNRGHRFASSNGGIHWFSRDASSSLQYAQWFGVPTDGVATAADGIQGAYNYCTNLLQMNLGYGSIPALQLPRGVMMIDHPINFSSLYSTNTTPLTANAGFRISGYGSYLTEFKVMFTNATDAQYPALDITGTENSQYDRFSVIIPDSSIVKPRAAILLARRAKGEVSGYNVFTDIHVTGLVGLAQMVIISSELNRFENCRFQQYSQGDQYSVLQIGYHLDTPEAPGVRRIESYGRHLDDSDAGGNGMNYFNLCWFHANPSNPSGFGGMGFNNLPRFRMEFTQHSTFDNCFWATPTNGTAAVEIDFRTEGPIFRGNRQEHSAGPAASSPFIRILSQSNGVQGQGPVNGLSIQNSAVGGIYATNGSQIFGMEVSGLRLYADSAIATSTVYPALDVWDMFNSRISVPKTSTNYSEPYLLGFTVRNESKNNAWMIPTNSVLSILRGQENDYDLTTKNLNAARYRGTELGGLEFLDAATANVTHVATSLNPTSRPGAGGFTLQMLVTPPIQTIDGSTHGLVALGATTNGTLFSANGIRMTMVQSDLNVEAFGASLNDSSIWSVKNFVPNYMGRRTAITLIRDAGQDAVRMYIDGYKQVVSNTIVNAGASWAQDFTGATKINIGGTAENSVANAFRGIVHRATLWTTALTEAQVQQEVKYGIRPNQGTLPAPVLDLSFTGNPGSTNIADLSGNGQRADVFGNPVWRTHYAAAGYVGSGGGGGISDAPDLSTYGRQLGAWTNLDYLYGRLTATNNWTGPSNVFSGSLWGNDIIATNKLSGRSAVVQSIGLSSGWLPNAAIFTDATTPLYAFNSITNSTMTWTMQNSDGPSAYIRLVQSVGGFSGSLYTYPTNHSSPQLQGRTTIESGLNGISLRPLLGAGDVRIERAGVNYMIVNSGLVDIETANTSLRGPTNSLTHVLGVTAEPVSASRIVTGTTLQNLANQLQPFLTSGGISDAVDLQNYGRKQGAWFLLDPLYGRLAATNTWTGISNTFTGPVTMTSATGNDLLVLDRSGSFTAGFSQAGGKLTINATGGALALQNSGAVNVNKNNGFDIPPYTSSGAVRPIQMLATINDNTLDLGGGSALHAVTKIRLWAAGALGTATGTQIAEWATNGLSTKTQSGSLSYVLGFDADPTGTTLRLAKSMTVSSLLSGTQPLDSDLTDLGNLAGVNGDIIIRSGGVWTRLGAGTSGNVLTMGATLPAWSAPTGGGGITDVPNDSKYYARRNTGTGAWADLAPIFQPLATDLTYISSGGFSAGDVLFYNSGWSRKTIGTLGQVLTVTAGNGIGWATPTGGGGIPEAPANTTTYGRSNTVWVSNDLKYQPLNTDLSYIGAGGFSQGDILMYNSGWSRKTIGTTGYVLTSTNGFPTWMPAPAGGGGGGSSGVGGVTGADVPFAVAAFTGVNGGSGTVQTLDGGNSSGVTTVTKRGSNYYEITLSAAQPASLYKRVEIFRIDFGPLENFRPIIVNDGSHPTSGTAIWVYFPTGLSSFDNGEKVVFKFYTADGSGGASGSGSSAAGTKTFYRFRYLDNVAPVANAAVIDTRNTTSPTLVLAFDDTTDQFAVFEGIVPEGITLTSVTCRLFVAAATATTGTMKFGMALSNMANDDSDADNWSTEATASVTTTATAGLGTWITITQSTLASVTGGSPFRCRIARRPSDTSNDTMVGNAHLIMGELRTQ